METRFTTGYLHKLEDIFAESDYFLRYEKGNFKAGFCVLKDTKVVIVNKYFTTEGKINCLLDILKTIKINTSRLSEKNKKLYESVSE